MDNIVVMRPLPCRSHVKNQPTQQFIYLLKFNSSKIPPQNNTCDKRKRYQMWKGGGLQVQNMNLLGEIRMGWRA